MLLRIFGILLLGNWMCSGAEIQLRGAGTDHLVYLSSLSDPKFKEAFPDSFVKAEGADFYRWKGLKKGRYQVRVSPDSESFSQEWIASKIVDLDQECEKVSISVPKSEVEISIRYDKIDIPFQEGGGLWQVYRVQPITPDGQLDSRLVQWLFAKKGESVGRLYYVGLGKWRITAFGYKFGNDEIEQSDLGFGEVTLTEKEIKAGKATVTINQKINSSKPKLHLEDSEKKRPAKGD